MSVYISSGPRIRAWAGARVKIWVGTKMGVWKMAGINVRMPLPLIGALLGNLSLLIEEKLQTIWSLAI